MGGAEPAGATVEPRRGPVRARVGSPELSRVLGRFWVWAALGAWLGDWLFWAWARPANARAAAEAETARSADPLRKIDVVFNFQSLWRGRSVVVWTAFDFAQSYSLDPLPRQLFRGPASYAFTAIRYALRAIGNAGAGAILRHQLLPAGAWGPKASACWTI